MNFKIAGLVISLILTLFLTACRTYPDYAGDFRFPIFRGDIEKGQEAFVSLGCTRCHSVDGVELPPFEGEKLLDVTLGGELVFAKTYAALATSIINPDHNISDEYLRQLPSAERSSVMGSPMTVNEDMTVAELVDIVTFLNSRYSLLPGYTEYYY